MTSAALLVALLAAPALAYQAAPAPSGPPPVTTESLREQAAKLSEDAVNPSVSELSLGARAGALFQEITGSVAGPKAAPVYFPKEFVKGDKGTLDLMQETADQRLAKWRREHREPPPPGLLDAYEKARAMKDQRRADYDREGRMSDNQMGVFEYNEGSAGDSGEIRYNAILADIERFIGHAFAFCTAIHEATHSLDKAAGRLNDKDDVPNEIRSFRNQYLWLSMIDPTGQKMYLLYTNLQAAIERMKDPPKALVRSADYLRHLAELLETGGDERKLEQFVRGLGYGAPKRAENPVRA